MMNETSTIERIVLEDLTMTPAMLRQFWSLVENTQANIILMKDDSTLVDWLMTHMNRQHPLATEDSACLGAYIRSRTTLIRDIAAAR